MFHSSHVLQIEAEGEGTPLTFYQLYSMITNDKRTSDYIISQTFYIGKFINVKSLVWWENKIAVKLQYLRAGTGHMVM